MAETGFHCGDTLETRSHAGETISLTMSVNGYRRPTAASSDLNLQLVRNRLNAARVQLGEEVDLCSLIGEQLKLRAICHRGKQIETPSPLWKIVRRISTTYERRNVYRIANCFKNIIARVHGTITYICAIYSHRTVESTLSTRWSFTLHPRSLSVAWKVQRNILITQGLQLPSTRLAVRPRQRRAGPLIPV